MWRGQKDGDSYVLETLTEEAVLAGLVDSTTAGQEALTEVCSWAE